MALLGREAIPLYGRWVVLRDDAPPNAVRRP